MRHSKEEAPEVFRISNNPDEGIVGVGAGAWHHDSLHLEQIPPYAMYHMRSVVNDVPVPARFCKLTSSYQFIIPAVVLAFSTKDALPQDIALLVCKFISIIVIASWHHYITRRNIFHN